MAIDQKLINRINALAKKKKEQGLTPSETEEQLELRKLYIAEFREGFKGKIEAVDFLKQFSIKKANIDSLKIEELKNHEHIKEVEELANTFLITYFCLKITDKEVKEMLKK